MWDVLYVARLFGRAKRSCAVSGGLAAQGGGSVGGLVPVAVAAEHLAVLFDRAAALAPRHDVVGLHELEVVRPSAEGAKAALFFENGEADVFGKGA